MDTYQAMSMTELASLVLNEKRENPIAKMVYQNRRKRLSNISGIIACLAQESPFIISFPRHPEFFSIFTCKGIDPKPPEILFSEEEQYKDFPSVCYLQTAVEIYSREDAKALLRPHFRELTVQPILCEQNGIQYGLWCFHSVITADYLEACDVLMRDDYFTVVQGDGAQLQELLNIK